MSTVTLDQPMTAPVFQGNVPNPLALSQPDSHSSLLITVPEILYTLEAPLAAAPIIEDDRIFAKFSVDRNVDLDLTLTGKAVENENKFQTEQYSWFFQIKEPRPRAHFIVATHMAMMGLVGKFNLQISRPEESININSELPLLEISKLLHRRQFTYRLMVIEEATGKQFLLPSAISEGEIERIAFVYHAIVDRSFIWQGSSFNTSIPATEEDASLFAQLVQSSIWPLPTAPLSEIVLGQPIHLGRATVTIEDAVVTNLDEVRKQLEAGDGRQVTFEVSSLSGQDKYEFTETPYSSGVLWEPKIQALIDLEPYLDAAIAERYHALAAATLEGLTEEEKIAITVRPELDEPAFQTDN
ncbi:MAG: hypothetical protein H0T60_02600 [Acidobacteria bacterium]|nr:hypothetical protein [Acidobacteriota bacterium]